MTFARRIGATVGGLLVLLAFVPSASADTSITVYPPQVRVVEGDDKVAATIKNTGTTPYTVTSSSGVKWASPWPTTFRLEPGEEQIVQIALKPKHPQEDAQVSFVIPAPPGSGIAAAGAVALQLDAFPFEVIPAPVETAPSTQLPLWPAALAGLVIVGAFVRRQRKKHRELVALANKSYGFGR